MEDPFGTPFLARLEQGHSFHSQLTYIQEAALRRANRKDSIKLIKEWLGDKLSAEQLQLLENGEPIEAAEAFLTRPFPWKFTAIAILVILIAGLAALIFN